MCLRLICAISLLSCCACAQQAIHPAEAEKAFSELHDICTRDAGTMWGASLCGPVLFVEPGTRQVAANQSDKEGQLKANGTIFTGTLPPDKCCANTALDWAGVHWTEVIWPLPESDKERRRLLVHESFHRIQDSLGLKMHNPANAHLDSLEGRYWLQLEWRALERALGEGKKTEALRDALTFRAWRRMNFPTALDEERQLEMNEGLAEYTGTVLATASNEEAAAFARESLQAGPNRRSFVRSFAYHSGPAYGVLLDRFVPGWRKRLKPTDDLGALLGTAAKIKLPPDVRKSAEERAAAYDGAALREKEVARDTDRRARIAEIRKTLIDGPVLSFPPGEKFSFSFDPGAQIPIDEGTTYFKNLRISDLWGVMEVTGGALLLRDERGYIVGVRVAAPADPKATPVTGPGWTLTLKPEWRLGTAPRAGDFTLTRTN